MSVTEDAAQEPLAHIRDRVAMVTGGTAGIGAAICRLLAEEGASVAAGYSRDTPRAEKYLQAMSEAYPGRRVTIHQGNIGLADDCRRVAQEVIDQHGRLDILVNNAGITIDRTVTKMTDRDWQHVLDINLSGAFFMAQAALDHMLERGTGRIINVSSVIGEIGNIGQANYAASKSGLFGLTKTLARETLFHLNKAEMPPGDGIGLTVNAVTPGFIATDMLATIPERVLDRIRSRSRSAGWASRRRSRGWSASWPRTTRPTSPGRSGPSTAAWTCDANPGWDPPAWQTAQALDIVSTYTRGGQ